MSPSRPNSLLLLLVVLPLALLAWLGISMHRDGERRLREATRSIILERLNLAQSHLLNELRANLSRLDRLTVDSLSAAVLADAEASSITQLKVLGPDTQSDPAEPAWLSPLRELSAERQRLIQKGVDPAAAVAGLSASAAGGWAALEGENDWPKSANASGLLLRRLATGAPQILYWRHLDDGHLLAAELKVERTLGASSDRFAPPWLAAGHGTVLLLSESDQVLRLLGNQQFDLTAAEQITVNCQSPLSGLRLSYLPGPNEFPSASLFPILLGATSGSLLLPSLAWLFFRENRRELRLAQQRVSFVNQVSHELKTPLTNIRLYAEMVRARAEEADDKISIRQLTVVESETARLSRLIQNVLNFARKQRERLSIQPRRICLSDLIDELAAQWRPILEKRGIQLHVEQPAKVKLEADPDALEQILGNLLSNIEKYAAEGCFVRLAVAEEARSVLVFVEDRGPGIPAGKQEVIFEPFERLRSDLREGVSGTGIGLTISRELARLHGGDLAVDPSYTHGARFVLTLPLQVTPELALAN
jgi:signal transduction histidine kinase